MVKINKLVKIYKSYEQKEKKKPRTENVKAMRKFLLIFFITLTHMYQITALTYISDSYM